MTPRSTSLRYGPVAVALHWTCAAAIAAALPLGFLAAHTTDMARAAHLVRIHAPLGLLILLLTLLSAAWRFVDRQPAPVAHRPWWLVTGAHAVHLLLYLVPFLLGSSGIALVALSGAAPLLFSGAPGALPRFWDFAPMAAHAAAAASLVALVCLHIVAACYHQFYRRDRLMARMGIGPERSATP